MMVLIAVGDVPRSRLHCHCLIIRLLFSRALIHNRAEKLCYGCQWKELLFGVCKDESAPLGFSSLGRARYLHMNVGGVPGAESINGCMCETTTCEVIMLMNLVSKIFLLWCLEHRVSTTSVSTLQRMHYSPVVRWCHGSLSITRSVLYHVITTFLYVKIREDFSGEEHCWW